MRTASGSGALLAPSAASAESDEHPGSSDRLLQNIARASPLHVVPRSGDEGTLDAPPQPRADEKPAGPAIESPDRRRFLLNVITSLGYVVLQTGLMLWFIPFVLGRLGLAAYGMIALVNSLIMYAAVLTDSLSSSTFRHLAIELHRGDTASARRTFNNALGFALAASAILLVPVVALTYLLPILFQVPADLAAATRFLFLSTSLFAFAAMIGGTFGASSQIAHRFDLRNLVRSLTTVSRVGVVALCFALWPASLWHVAFGAIVGAFVGLVGDILVWRVLTPQLSINFRLIAAAEVAPLMKFSVWSAINTAGLLLLMQVDLLIANTMLGAEATGRYGSVMLVPVLIYTLMEAVLPVLNPLIMQHYASGEREALREFVGRSVKFIALALALPVGLLCGLGRPLLSLWLGPEMAEMDVVLALLVGHLTISLATRPLAYALLAHNGVRLQGITTLAFGAFNIVLAIGLAHFAGLGLVGIAAATALTWTLRSVLFLASYSAVLMGLRWYAYWKPLIAGGLGTIGVALLCRAAALAGAADWVLMLLFPAAVSVAYCLIAYVFVLSHQDRALVASFLAQPAARQRRSGYRRAGRAAAGE